MSDLEMLLPIEYRVTAVSHDFGPAIKCPGGVNNVGKRAPDQWWQYNDGGRYDAGYIGDVGDCATRAIAIATQTAYQAVYDDICTLAINDCGHAQAHMGATSSVIREYLECLGWTWNDSPGYLNAAELPGGRLIVSMKGHLVAVVDGVINDLFDCSVGGTQKIKGYYSFELDTKVSGE
jgi:hypothetical protein